MIGWALAIALAAGPWPKTYIYSANQCDYFELDVPPQIGLSIDTCMKVRRMDRALNRAYQARLVALPPHRREALRRSQRLWLERINFDCEAGHDGSISQATAARCFLPRARRRIAFITAFR